MMTKKVEISYKTITFTLAVLLLAWVFYLIRDIVLLVYVGMMLTLALGPTVDKLESWRIPRILAVLVNYFAFFGLLVLALSLLAGPLIQQSGLLIQQVVGLGERVGLGEWLSGLLNDPLKNILPLSGGIFRLTQDIFNNLVQVFSVFVFSFYLILDRKKIPGYLGNFLGKDRARKFGKVAKKIEGEIGHWLWGQVLLMVIVAALTYLALLLLRFPYALPLAFLAGLLEVLPNVGPIIAAIPAAVVGFTISPLMGLLAIAAFFLVQQIESNLITPKVMQGVTGLNPMVTILGLLIGFRLAGVVGAVFTLPTVLIIKVLVKELVLPRLKKAN
jgi:predicted PurR-regulated permease PerM